MNAILEKLDVALAQQLSACRRFSIAMAMVSCDGLAMLEGALEKCLKRDGAEGQFLFGVDLPTDPEAIEYLMKLASRHADQFTLRRFESGRQGIFHSKLYLFESHRGPNAAILGSSNLTGSGLNANVEANVLVNDARVVKQLWSNFDEHFEGGHAKDVDTTWLTRYRKIWQDRKDLLKDWRQNLAKIYRVPTRQTQLRAIPKRILGTHFLFTGRIPEHPRRELYPEIEQWGGVVRTSAKSAGTVHCLVHGNIVGGNTTVKLKAARNLGTPVIYEEQFLAILDRERELRKRKKAR